MSAPTRRGILASAGLVLAACGITAAHATPADPDAALIAACGALVGHEAELQRVVVTGEHFAFGTHECDRQEAEVARLIGVVDDALRGVEQTEPRTMAGLAAKARVMANLRDEMWDQDRARLGIALGRDVLAVAGVEA
jgi:hypothetical protein